MEALRLVSLERHGDRVGIDKLSSQVVAELPQLALIGGLRKFTL
jgi:hypothetical protein